MRGTDTMEKLRKQNGSYTLEALISLTAFVLVIMLAYMQVKAVIAEQIMQHAVNNISQQVASYVYVLDRAGLVIQHAEDELSDTNTLVNTTVSNFNEMSEVVSGIFSSKEINSGTAKDVSSSFTKFIEGIVNGIQNNDWKAQGKSALLLAGDDMTKQIANYGMGALYPLLLENYLPMDKASFCKVFNIKEDSISFELSKVFPTEKNNSIFVAVSYDAYPAYRFADIGERKVIKCAYSAAWVKSNAGK